MINRLLKYWYALEFFQPSWPDNMRDGENLERVLENELVWCDLEGGSDPDTMIYCDVYVGRGLTCSLSEWLLNALGHGDDEIVETGNSQTALLGIKLTESGVYCSGSFAVSGFGWAVGALANDRGDKLTEDDIKRFQNECDFELFGDEAAFTFDGLLELLKKIRIKIELEGGLFLPEVWIKRDIYKRDENGEFPKINNYTELMQSFYIADIARIMEKSSVLVENFGQALVDESKKRHEIDIDSTVMNKWLDAERFPIGAWFGWDAL